MKKILYILMFHAIFFSSCEDYLDVKKEAIELTAENIFTDFYEYRDFLNGMYNSMNQFTYYPFYSQRNSAGTPMFAGFPSSASDESRQFDSYLFEDRWFNVSEFQNVYMSVNGTISNTQLSIWKSAWDAIRVACVTIKNIEMLENATPEQKNELLGQAYMGRAFTYANMLVIWGGMPYLESPLTSEESFDLTRLSYYETAMKIVEDCDKAASLLPTRWDSGNPADGYYNNTEDVGRFTSVAAKALKSRMLLYAASPLAEAPNSQEAWKAAAIASWDAIQYAENNHYGMLPGNQYTSNFYGQFLTDETLLITRLSANTNIIGPNHNLIFGQYVPYSIYNNGNAHCIEATNDQVERYEAVELDASGKIIRALPVEQAEQAGFYNLQDPFKDGTRDPRFYTDIIYHGRNIVKWTANWPAGTWSKITTGRKGARKFDMSEGSYDTKQNNIAAYTNKTGYFVGKFWNGGVPTNGTNVLLPFQFPGIRMSELFLNYAEAANEAYGVNGTAPGASLTALQSVNKVRNRVGMPNIDAQFTGNTPNLRRRILNERAVELSFELAHRYTDVRRWKMIADDEYRDTYKMLITLDSSNDKSKYPTGYVYQKKFLEKRPYELKHYFFPCPKYDLDKSPSFIQNPGY